MDVLKNEAEISIRKILDRINYLSFRKIDILDAYYFNYTKTRVNSDDDLPLEKTLNSKNVIIFIKSIVNNNS